MDLELDLAHNSYYKHDQRIITEHDVQRTEEKGANKLPANKQCPQRSKNYNNKIIKPKLLKIGLERVEAKSMAEMAKECRGRAAMQVPASESGEDPGREGL